MDPKKSKMALVDLNFVAAIADIINEGVKNGREIDDWKTLDWTSDLQIEYVSALLRHTRDEDWAAVAANAMILHHHCTQEGPAIVEPKTTKEKQMHGYLRYINDGNIRFTPGKDYYFACGINGYCAITDDTGESNWKAPFEHSEFFDTYIRCESYGVEKFTFGEYYKTKGTETHGGVVYVWTFDDDSTCVMTDLYALTGVEE